MQKNISKVYRLHFLYQLLLKVQNCRIVFCYQLLKDDGQEGIEILLTASRIRNSFSRNGFEQNCSCQWLRLVAMILL
ncbi:uncharacterized protein [Euphorbia lathyris]|uniref:uncharacterized protein isoform X2 n=1 Tax=Euphorbia lathyris TaxID=212925 RepID=UPI00331414A2